MRSQLLALLVLTLAVGCPDHQLPPPTVWTTHLQLTQFTERALAAMRSHEGIRLPGGGVAPVVGEYDGTKPIRYWTQDGEPPSVFVHIPTRSGSSYSYAVFTFDAYSGEITAVSFGMIHRP
jgi:hypothetical protein